MFIFSDPFDSSLKHLPHHTLVRKHIGIYKFVVVWPQIPCKFSMFFPKITKKKVKNLDNLFFFIWLYLNMSATFDDILLGTDDGWILLWWLVTKRYYQFHESWSWYLKMVIPKCNVHLCVHIIVSCIYATNCIYIMSNYMYYNRYPGSST